MVNTNSILFIHTDLVIAAYREMFLLQCVKSYGSLCFVNCEEVLIAKYDHSYTYLFQNFTSSTSSTELLHINDTGYGVSGQWPFLLSTHNNNKNNFISTSVHCWMNVTDMWTLEAQVSSMFGRVRIFCWQIIGKNFTMYVCQWSKYNRCQRRSVSQTNALLNSAQTASLFFMKI